MNDYRNLRRLSDKEIKPKTEWWALLGLVVLALGGTLFFLTTLIDSLPE